MKERLQKVLAAAGLASRRQAEELILTGEVMVNGRVATIGEVADPDSDSIVVRGVPISHVAAREYLALHKPVGYVTSLRSTHGERTVAEFLDGSSRIFPVGRLDKLTSGLLLMTNDGDWSNLVTHPRYAVEKEYLVVVRGRPSEDALLRLRSGVQLPDGDLTVPARVVELGGDRNVTRLSVTVIEGKKRQIRLMAGAVGHPVILLHRVRVGSIELGDLGEGCWRRLQTTEVESIRGHGRRMAARGGTSPRSTGCH